MRHYKGRIIGAIVGLAALRAFYPSSPIDDIPANHTGKVALSCEGETFQLSDAKDGKREIVKGTKQTASPTTLTLAFDKGLVTSWEATVDPTKRPSEPVSTSQLISRFENVCRSSKTACVPTQNYKMIELYYDSKTHGVGYIKNDLSEFGSFFEKDGKAYGNAMDCKISEPV